LKAGEIGEQQREEETDIGNHCVASTTSVLKDKLSSYYFVTKPNVISLLVFAAVSTVVITQGWKTSPLLLLAVGGSVWMGSAGANTLGSYFDRDIDAVMSRTKRRPIPMGYIAPKNALVYGLGLGLISVFISSAINPVSGLFMTAGIVDYVLVYSVLLKRRTWLNVILGGFSGMMPVFVGYSASFSHYFYTPPLKNWETATLIGILVFLWIPSHIWSLALKYKNDYQSADVPMLPVVFSEKNSVRAIGLTGLAIVAFTFFLWYYGGLGIVYLGFSLVFGGGMLLLVLWLIRNPSAQNAWKVFKYSSPYLTLLFIAMVLDSLLI
jgi:protoheme IX farnesyltransferase